jgi:hypothetical protein
VQQPGLQTLFQLKYVLADHGPRQAQPAAGLAEAAQRATSTKISIARN